MSHTKAYSESIAGLQALVYNMKDSGSHCAVDMSFIEDAIADLRFAQRQEEQFKLASQDARRSLAQEIGETLRIRGYWVPEDVMSADLISAVGQALQYTKEVIDFLQDHDKLLSDIESVLSMASGDISGTLSEMTRVSEALHKILDPRIKKASDTRSNLEELRDLVQGAFAVVNAMAQADPGDDFMALKPECEKLNERYNALSEINKLLNTKQVP